VSSQSCLGGWKLRKKMTYLSAELSPGSANHHHHCAVLVPQLFSFNLGAFRQSLDLGISAQLVERRG